MRSSWSHDSQQSKARLPPLSRSPVPGDVPACKSSSVLSASGVLARRRPEPHRLDPLQGLSSSASFEVTPSVASNADADALKAKAKAKVLDGKALAEELAGKPEVQRESVDERVQKKAKAVASLQKLFFEELRDSGDRNAAAATALRRLVEERPEEYNLTVTCP
ncbi:unnamed protein product [Durusdinium trenchii]|uniref:Uncharacterized protein n=1 Tax=Durusdinium trenchii TaxID=1381693 RepID=A0ABP0JYP6_9DINO